jgi:hypothetical protein
MEQRDGPEWAREPAAGGAGHDTGQTTDYLKTTLDNLGNVASVKTKF